MPTWDLQIFPDMFDDYVNLRPLKGVAEILAQDDSWNTLYDTEKLAKNEVKVTAATQVSFLVNIGPFTDLEHVQVLRRHVSMPLYSRRTRANDLHSGRYVDFGLAQDTASKIKNTEQYITNQLFHNAIRYEANDVMKHLFAISRREYD
jgi:hypothetical protein